MQKPYQHISTHSRAKAAGTEEALSGMNAVISTHSRAKAAGKQSAITSAGRTNFNSQPREGGWIMSKTLISVKA